MQIFQTTQWLFRPHIYLFNLVSATRTAKWFAKPKSLSVSTIVSICALVSNELWKLSRHESFLIILELFYLCNKLPICFKR